MALFFLIAFATFFLEDDNFVRSALFEYRAVDGSFFEFVWGGFERFFVADSDDVIEGEVISDIAFDGVDFDDGPFGDAELSATGCDDGVHEKTFLRVGDFLEVVAG